MTTEEIVKAAHEAGFSSSEIFQRLAAFKRLIESAAAAERDACAKVCFDTGLVHEVAAGSDLCFELEALIRARGNK